MAVFYKYVDRQVSDQINWADISKSLSQTFDAERDAREKKKAEIDQASLEYIEKLQSQPQTESKGLNDRLGQFTSDASAMSKTMLDDLKAGRINLRDYSVRTQNLKSDTNVALDLVQTYGKRYSEVMKGIKDGDLSAAQESFMARFEGFANLANNRLYVDPTSGRVYAADEVLDPKTGVKKMGNKIQNVSALKQMMEQDIPRVNVNSELDARAKALGGFIDEEIRKGKYYSTAEGIKFEDATKQEAYDKSLKNITNELVGGEANPMAVSFFVDNMRVASNGSPYKLVYSEADRKSPSDILMKEGASGVYFPSLTQEQINDAEKFIKVEMRQKIKSSTERDIINLPQPPQKAAETDEQRKAKGKAEEERNEMSYIMQLAFPTSASQRQAALDHINNLQVKTKDGTSVVYDFYGGGLRATYDNDPNKTRIFKINKGMTQEQWAATTREIHGIGDVGRVLRENVFETTKTPTNPVKGTVSSNVTQKSPVIVLQDRVKGLKNRPLSDFYQDGDSKEVDEDAVVKALKGILGDSGFDISGTGRVGDKVTITQKKQIAQGTGDKKKLISPSKEFNVNNIYTKEGYDAFLQEVSDWLNQSGSVDREKVTESERARRGQGSASSTSTGTGSKLQALQNKK
jgi:hypothetical protein